MFPQLSSLFSETLAKVCKGCSKSESSSNFSLAEFITIEPIVIRGLQGIETLRLEEPSSYVMVSLNDGNKELESNC